MQSQSASQQASRQSSAQESQDDRSRSRLVASPRPRNRRLVASPRNRPIVKTGKAMGNSNSKAGKAMDSSSSKAGRTTLPTTIYYHAGCCYGGYLRWVLSLRRWGLCGWGRHGRDHWFDDNGGRVQCPGRVVYDDGRERHNLLSMRVNVVSADDAREPGDVYRGEPAEVEKNLLEWQAAVTPPNRGLLQYRAD